MDDSPEPTTRYRLIIFDVDGTLAENYRTQLLPGVREWFASRPADLAVAIATNQGGVGLRYWMERDSFGNPRAYPTRERVIRRLRIVARKLAIPWRAVYVAFAYRNKQGELSPTPEEFAADPAWAHDWRKPEAGMIRQAMTDANVPAEATLMVGDREDDRGAAELAGVDFRWADAFFGRADPARQPPPAAPAAPL
jgi:HAD superfamily hydrolase (TIGR01662 family)